MGTRAEHHQMASVPFHREVLCIKCGGPEGQHVIWDQLGKYGGILPLPSQVIMDSVGFSGPAVEALSNIFKARNGLFILLSFYTSVAELTLTCFPCWMLKHLASAVGRPLPLQPKVCLTHVPTEARPS